MTKASVPSALDRLRGAISGPDHEQPPGHPPATVTGPLGTVPGAAAQVDTTAQVTPPAPLSARQADALMTAELLSAVRSLVESTTELAGRLGRRGAVNGVLESWAGVIPASGVIQRTYEVAIGCVSCENISAANLMTIASGVPAGDTGGQTAGTGVTYVRANSRGLAPIADHSFSITGTPGDKVSFEVWAGLQAFGVMSL